MGSSAPPSEPFPCTALPFLRIHHSLTSSRRIVGKRIPAHPHYKAMLAERGADLTNLTELKSVSFPPFPTQYSLAHSLRCTEPPARGTSRHSNCRPTRRTGSTRPNVPAEAIATE